MKGLSVQQTCEVISRYNVADDLECVSNLLSLDSVERATVLRDHNKRSVSDKNEIEYRRALDGVLELISALEVISIASNAMPELPPELGREFLAILEDTYIKNYYEAFYPMALPILCRAHLNLPGK